MKISKLRLRNIIKEVLDDQDLAVDPSLNIPIKTAPGRLQGPEGDYQWAEPGVRRGRLDPSTSNIGTDEMHIFDFDDTLGEGFGPTLIAAAIVKGGILRPITNFVQVLNALGIEALSPEEAMELEGFKDALQQNSMKIIKDRWFFSSGAVGLNGAEIVTLDTAGFADFRKLFSKIKTDQSFPIPAETGGTGLGRLGSEERKIDFVIGEKGFTTMDGIPKNIKKMEGKPDGSMLIAYDFSPSLTLGSEIERYDATNDLALDAQSQGEPLGVITARKGVTEFDSFSGNRPVAMNAKDMRDFLTKGGLKWTPNSPGGGLKFVHGAADYSNDGGKQKARLAKAQWLKQPQKNLRFYDDDKRNAKAMSDLCDDPDILSNKSGGSINIYSQPHGGFKKSIGQPVFSCMIEGKRKYLSESQFRKFIRKSILSSWK